MGGLAGMPLGHNVATHWHDDHIRGTGKLVEVCSKATFCYASVLGANEFLSAVGAMASYPMSKTGSGIRRIFNRDGCEIWSLSPFDIMNRKREVIERFITDDLPKAVAEQQWTDGADEVYVNGDSFLSAFILLTMGTDAWRGF